MARETGLERVSDAVWAQVADGGVHVDEREARVLRRSAFGVAAVLVAAICLWVLGVISPRLEHGGSSGGTMNAATHTAQYDFDLVNRGLWRVSVVGVSIDVPGVVVRSTTPASVEVPGGSSRHLRIDLHVRDCATAVRAVRTADDSRPPSLLVLVARPWGTVTSDVRPSGQQSWVGDLVLYACGKEP